MAEWFEKFFGGLYAEVLAAMFDEKQNLEQARLIKRLLKLRKGQKALDIPCGMGRLTIPLATMGLEMTGLDLVPSYIRKARRRAKKERPAIRFIQGDMRDIEFENEFDAAFNWFTSFGYFSDEDDLLFLKKVLKALKPGGRFLIEMINKSSVLSHPHFAFDEMRGGVRVINRPVRLDRQKSRMTSTWKFIKGRKRERHTITLRHYNGADIRRLLRKAGFRDITLFGHPPLGRLMRHSRRLIAMGTKPLDARE
jgi:ubiquinone/menaquinone biosynthesis C-methylase UbiE